MKQHKWHKEIKAWADGADIESRTNDSQAWIRNETPAWIPSFQYRIKPQQQQSSCCKCQQTCSALKEPQYLYVYRTNKGIELGLAPHPAMNMYNTTIMGKIKLENEASSLGDEE